MDKQFIIKTIEKKQMDIIKNKFSVQDLIIGYNYCLIEKKTDNKMITELYKNIIEKITEAKSIYVAYMKSFPYPYIDKSKTLGINIWVFSKKEYGEESVAECKKTNLPLEIREMSGENFVNLCRDLVMRFNVQSINLDNSKEFICFDITHVTGKYTGEELFVNPELVQRMTIYTQDLLTPNIVKSILDEEEQLLEDSIKKSNFLVAYKKLDGRDDQVNLPLLKNSIDKTTIQPIFTDWEELLKWDIKAQGFEVFVADIITIASMIQNENQNIVINPFGSNLNMKASRLIELAEEKKGIASETENQESK